MSVFGYRSCAEPPEADDELTVFQARRAHSELKPEVASEGRLLDEFQEPLTEPYRKQLITTRQSILHLRVRAHTPLVMAYARVPLRQQFQREVSLATLMSVVHMV